MRLQTNKALTQMDKNDIIDRMKRHNLISLALTHVQMWEKIREFLKKRNQALVPIQDP